MNPCPCSEVPLPTHHHGAADDAVWSREGNDGILDGHLGHASLGSHIAQVSHVPAQTHRKLTKWPALEALPWQGWQFVSQYNKGSQIQWSNLSCTLGGTLPLFSELLLSRTAQLFHRKLQALGLRRIRRSGLSGSRSKAMQELLSPSQYQG